MKLYKLFSLFVIAFSVAQWSCSRERIEPTEELNAYEPVDSYLDSKKQDEQEFEITEEGTGPIQGEQGTRIWISKDILMFPDGSDVDWPFTVRLVELYTPKDMIYYQMPTISLGKILQTEGEVRIRAFKEDPSGNEQELVLKPDAVFPIEMPTDSIISDMKVFYGYEFNDRPNWTDQVSSVGGNSADLYFIETSYGYRANIGKLGWVNCGYPHQGFYSIAFTSDVDDLSNVEIFTYLPETKTVGQSYDQVTCEMPDSSFVKILAIAINSSNELYYQYAYTTLTGTGSMPIALEPITDAQLSAILDGL